MKQWFVGATKDQRESTAAANLREQGFIVYLPKVHSRWQDGRRVSAHTALRFTGYIFIQFDAAAQEHGPIGNTRGMDELLITKAGDPIPLPASIIETLRQIEDEEFARAVARKKPVPRKDLVPGDMVAINNADDPFHGKQGMYLGTDRLVARVLLGLAIKDIAECDLKKIEPPERKAA